MKLKWGRSGTDKPDMFLHCTDPLPLSEACLHTLCASLNAPVVRVEELPPGPVRAAIVIYAQDYGDFGLAIGLRALETGQVAVYKHRTAIPQVEQVPAALDEALSFAEGLGFLFDEDMIEAKSGKGRREALEHWNRLMGEGEVFAAPAVADPPRPPVAEPGDELSEESLLTPVEDLMEVSAVLLPTNPELGVPSHTEPVANVPGADATSDLLLDDLMDLVSDDDGDDLLLDTGAESAAAGWAGPVPELDDALAAVPLTKFRRDAGSAMVEETLTASRMETMQAPSAEVQALAAKARAKKSGAGGKKKQSKAAAAEAEDDAPALLADAPAADVTDLDAQEDGAPGVGGRALGRIPIVRRRKGGGTAEPGFIARLLASF